MLVRIGLPGNSYHTYERFATRAECEAWAKTRLSRGDLPFDARYSILTEKEAAKCRYRDGSKCYPVRGQDF